MSGVDTVSEMRHGGSTGGPTQISIEIPQGLLPDGGGSSSEDSPTLATQLASDVGSTCHDPKDAFRRSITFYKDQPEEGQAWGLTLLDPPATSRSNRRRALGRANQPKLTVESVDGVVSLSHIRAGDELLSINGKRIGPSYNADRAMLLMDQCLEEDGYLSVVVGNENGEDILVQATIIKPRSDMTYEEMGMIVWKWGVLCVKSIDKESIFKKTVLSSEDHIISINDIMCDKMTPEGFAHVLNELPKEVHILIRRGKQRWSGKFG